MPEAVIVATGRTPIGRANKGSLIDCRPDDLAALVIREVLAKVPELDPQSVEDVIMGSGQPGGEAGYNVGRVAALLAGLPDVPGVTVNRYCSSSLQTIRMAAHAIRAGEGRRLRGRRRGDGQPLPERCGRHRPAQRGVRRGRGPYRSPHPGRRRTVGTPGRPPRRVHRHGPDGRERGRVQEGQPRGAGRVRPPVADPGRRRSGVGVLRSRDHPGDHAQRGRGHQGRRPSGRHHPRGAGRPQAGVPRRRHRHRRQRLPAQRRGRRRHRDERHQGPRARHHPVGPHRGQRSHRAQSGDHGPGTGRGHPPDARAGPDDHRRHRPGRDQRGLRRPGGPLRPGPRHQLRQAQREGRRHRSRPPVRPDRGPHHDHAAQCPGRHRARPSGSSRCASAAARAWP